MKRREIRCPEYEEGFVYRLASSDGEVSECGELAPLLRRLAERVTEDGLTFKLYRERRDHA